MFFDASDRVHQTMRRVTLVLEQAGIAYAVVGGMAVNAHQYRRTTADVDFLLTSEGLAAFSRLLSFAQFQRVKGRSRRFIDSTTGVTFDVIVAGLFPGSGKPGPIAFPEPSAVAQTIDDIRVINLPRLIELKLAAHRHKDFGDVVELIGIHDLDEQFANQLHPSVCKDYMECLEEMRREREYELRQDHAVDEKQRESGG